MGKLLVGRGANGGNIPPPKGKVIPPSVGATDGALPGLDRTTYPVRVRRCLRDGERGVEDGMHFAWNWERHDEVG